MTPLTPLTPRHKRHKGHKGHKDTKDTKDTTTKNNKSGCEIMKQEEKKDNIISFGRLIVKKLLPTKKSKPKRRKSANAKR